MHNASNSAGMPLRHLYLRSVSTHEVADENFVNAFNGSNSVLKQKLINAHLDDFCLGKLFCDCLKCKIYPGFIMERYQSFLYLSVSVYVNLNRFSWFCCF